MEWDEKVRQVSRINEPSRRNAEGTDQTVTKGLSSSSKFSGSCVPTLQTLPSLLSLLLSLGALYVHPSLRTEWVRSEGRKERVTTRTTGVTEGWAGDKNRREEWCEPVLSLTRSSLLPSLIPFLSLHSFVVPLGNGMSEKNDKRREWGELMPRERSKGNIIQPFVDSVLLTLSPLASFACHSLRSLGGAGPEDGSERGWMACSRAERTENRSERLTHGINVSPLVVMFRPPCVVPSVSTSSVSFHSPTARSGEWTKWARNGVTGGEWDERTTEPRK